MCGLVGAIVSYNNGFTAKTEDVFYEMLYADVLRGSDSTGMIFVENDASFGIMKDAHSAEWVIPDFQKSDMGKRVIAKGKALLGHNRKATMGSINKNTAHPFVVNDSFAMVHNGTLRNHKELADTVVDSEALAIHLSKVLHKDFDKVLFEEAIGKVNGAYAIAAYQQENNTVYLTRNSERPLSYVITPMGMFWASESDMLVWICRRNGLDIKADNLHHLPPNVLLSYDLDTNIREEVAYTPKKPTPAPTMATGTVAGRGMVYGNNTRFKSVSKNQYKAIRNQWMGRRIGFYVEDYVEKEFPKTIVEGAYELQLIGESDEFTCQHTVYGEFDIKDMAPDDNTFLDCLYSGLISGMSFNKITGSIAFYTIDVKRVPTPVLKLAYENKSTIH